MRSNSLAHILALLLVGCASVEGFCSNKCPAAPDVSTITIANRRNFIASVTGSLASLTPLITNADEPSNVQVKSKADEEDPIAAFGRSLQDMSFDSTAIEKASDKGSPSYSDISLPSSLPKTNEGGDLSQAIQQMKDKKRVDPRTHG